MQMKKLIFLAVCACTCLLTANAQVTTAQLWINEIHYDGNSPYGTSDSNEFIELVIHNDLLDDTDELAKYKLVLYSVNGFDLAGNTVTGKGLPYHEASLLYSETDAVHALDAVSTNGDGGWQQCAVPDTEYSVLYKNMPTLMDLPAAMALIYDDASVVQLLSYEAQFRVKNSPEAGAAADMPTVLMVNDNGNPVSESTASENDHSIQLEGTGGAAYADFTWDDAPSLTATPCARNENQTFAAALPAELISFSGSPREREIELVWFTATERNNRGFGIERRDPGRAEFREIGYKDGLGDSDEQRGYRHFDGRNIQRNTTYFYRLRQEDRDGTLTYSDIISVTTGDEGADNFRLSPNPTGGQTTLELRDARPGTTVEIHAADGLPVFFRILPAGGYQAINIETGSWATGVYIVRIQDDRGVYTERLLTE